jgi:hypothetical protein
MQDSVGLTPLHFLQQLTDFRCGRRNDRAGQGISWLLPELWLLSTYSSANFCASIARHRACCCADRASLSGDENYFVKPAQWKNVNNFASGARTRLRPEALPHHVDLAARARPKRRIPGTRRDRRSRGQM